MSTTLYSFWRSSTAYRARIALALKGIDYETVAVDIFGGEGGKPEHLARNPMGTLPVLEIDGHRLQQSLAMIEYLDETRPEPPLLPADPVLRCHARALAHIIATDIHARQNTSTLNELIKRFGATQDQVRGWYRHWLYRCLGAMEKMVAEHAGLYCVGDTITLPDLCLAPQMVNARLVSLDFSGMPTLSAIDERLRALPAFADTAPERQPDAPTEAA